jgi:hypothetical protein
VKKKLEKVKKIIFGGIKCEICVVIFILDKKKQKI